MQIYVDMDGVVADFDKSIVNVFGEEYSNKVADEFWKYICVERQVFRRMPEIPEGMYLVSRLLKEKLPVCFLTSTGGMPHHIDIAKQKLDWLHQHGLGQLPVAFAMNTEGKGAYAQPGAVLIDDRQKVVDEWDMCGGQGILFERHRVDEILTEL